MYNIVDSLLYSIPEKVHLVKSDKCIVGHVLLNDIEVVRELYYNFKRWSKFYFLIGSLLFLLVVCAFLSLLIINTDLFALSKCIVTVFVLILIGLASCAILLQYFKEKNTAIAFKKIMYNMPTSDEKYIVLYDDNKTLIHELLHIRHNDFNKKKNSIRDEFEIWKEKRHLLKN